MVCHANGWQYMCAVVEYDALNNDHNVCFCLPSHSTMTHGRESFHPAYVLLTRVRLTPTGAGTYAGPC
jgi:hypothetical protein